MSTKENNHPLPIPYNLKDGFAHLQSSFYRIDLITGNPIDRNTTKQGHQLDASQGLFETAARLADGQGLLNDSVKILQDPNASKTRKKNATRNIKKLGPLMGVASNIASEVATIASPIASGKECHRRLQTIYKTTEINLVLKKKHNKVALIDKYVRNEGLPSSLEPSPSKVTPSPTTRRQKRKLPSIVPDPPMPAGGKERV